MQPTCQWLLSHVCSSPKPTKPGLVLTPECVSELNQRLCNHPADFSVRMVDYSKWDKLQTSDEEDAKPQPPPIPVPWKPCSDLEHPTSCLGDWRNCLFWKLLGTGYMQQYHAISWDRLDSVDWYDCFCRFVCFLSTYPIGVNSSRCNRNLLHFPNVGFIPRTIIQKDHSTRTKRDQLRLAWSWAGYSKIFKAVHSLKLT